MLLQQSDLLLEITLYVMLRLTVFEIYVVNSQPAQHGISVVENWFRIR